MFIKRVSLSALLCLSMAISGKAYTYTLTEIVVPGLTNTAAMAVNKSGAVVGYGTGSGGTVGFLDVNGTFSFLSFPGSAGTKASGINDAGDIVGTYLDNAGSHGFKYSGGTYIAIDAPSPALPNTTTLAAINNSGQIAGNASTASSPRGFVATGGSFVFPGSGEFTRIDGLNDSGEFVGIAGNPIYGTGNGYTQVTGDPTASEFTAVNNHGQVALTAPANAGTFSYLLASPTDQNFTTYIEFPNAASTAVRGLNDADTVVGIYYDGNGQSHAFIGTTGPAPSCVITGYSGPPRQVNFAVQDTNSGLNQIVDRNSTNSNLNIPYFTQGTTAPVSVTATASDPSQIAIPSIVASNLAGGAINCMSQISPGPPVWTGLAGIIESNVSIGRNQDGSLEAFGVGTDGGLWHRAQVPQWSKLDGVPDTLTGDPVVFSDSTGALQVLITSSTGVLWNIAQPTPTSWRGAVWQRIQSGVKGNAAVVVDAAGVANTFIRAADNSVEWLTQHTSSSSTWSVGPSLGGILISNPVGILDAARNLHVYGTGEDNALWDGEITSQGTVIPWTWVGGSLKGDPTVISSVGTLYAFGRGTDDSLWFDSRVSGGTWNAFESLGGVLTNNPRATANSDGRVEVFVSGDDSAVWHKSQVAAGSQGYTDWSTLGGMIVGDIFPIFDSEAILNLYALGSDRSLWLIRQPLPGNWQ